MTAPSDNRKPPGYTRLSNFARSMSGSVFEAWTPMSIRRFVALAKEGWLNRPQTQLFSVRAEEIRRMALSLEAWPPRETANAQAEQDTYVRLVHLAQTSPRDAVREGWNVVAGLLKDLSHQRAIPRGNDTVRLLNVLESSKQLDFHAYALLRDMHAFKVDMAATSASAISLSVAQDYAVAVRGAQRLLCRLTSRQIPG